MACLNIQDLCMVRDKAHQAKDKWFDLGLSLKVDPGTLASIRIQHHAVPGDCYREMLMEWSKSSSKNKTWRALAKALRDEAVGYGDLADKIEQSNEGKEESAQGEQAKSRKRESSNCDREPN